MSEMRAVEPAKVAGFVDSGYNRNKRQKRIEEEEAEIARLEAEARGEVEPQREEEPQEEQVEAQQQEEDDSNLSAEEKSFKKRYGDLRRHMQEKEREWNEKFESLQKTARKQNIVPPKTDEDIEQWAKRYPDVAGIVETIAAKKAQQLFAKAESRLRALDEAEAEAQRVKAENKIRKSHADFDDLRSSDEFHDWAENQPKWVKDALYENMDDPDSVIRVIDLYKIDNGMTPNAQKQSRKAAASPVSRGSRASIDTKGQQGTIRESEVARMSAREFEERQDEITEAMRKGKFVYDISGSAR